jgi:hypothetical protein
MTHSFDAELNALKTIYETLRPFAIHERDRIVRMVQERLARERASESLSQRNASVDFITLSEARKR